MEFEITAAAADPAAPPDDGDPVGRLLPLVKDGWWLVSGAGQPAKLHPGRNRAEVVGRLITFNLHPGGFTKATAQAWVWLTSDPAAEQSAAAAWPPVDGEYLGKIDRWHVYAHFTDVAKKDWPAARDDVARALARAAGAKAENLDGRALADRILAACAKESLPSVAALAKAARVGRDGESPEHSLIDVESNMTAASKAVLPARKNPARPYQQVSLAVRPVQPDGALEMSDADRSIRWDGTASVRGYRVKRLGVEIVISVRGDEPGFVERVNAIIDGEVSAALAGT